MLATPVSLSNWTAPPIIVTVFAPQSYFATWQLYEKPSCSDQAIIDSGGEGLETGLHVGN